jgi:hypothetical protein
MMDALAALPPGGGMIAAGCAALGLSRASLHRRRRPAAALRARAKPRRALDGAERQFVLEQLGEPRFVDLAPAEVYACLLDEGVVTGTATPPRHWVEVERDLRAGGYAQGAASWIRPGMMLTLIAGWR